MSGAGDHDPPCYPGGIRGEKWRPGFAEVSLDAGRGYVSLPLRNIGPGPAQFTEARLEIEGSSHTVDVWGVTKQFVPSGEVVRLSFVLGSVRRRPGIAGLQ